MSNDQPCIAFTGGGTGGHIYPGLAVIAALREKCAARIIWIGSDSGMDRSIVEGSGLEFFGIPSGKLRRYVSLKNISDVFKIIAGFFAAKKILKKQNVCFLFSKGGFVSVPPVAAASVLKIPLWTHESDFSPGLATKINSRFAHKICLAYEKTALYFNAAAKSKTLVCGNPVRLAFYAANAEKGRAFLKAPKTDRILLVLGGSQGAKEINDLVASCLDTLTKYFFVAHQTGAQNADAAQRERYLPLAYIKDEMPDVLASACLVLGRSGAGTVWECAACGCPMVLVPLCGSGTRGDQVENASYFTERGAAKMLVRPDAKTLCDAIVSLAEDDSALGAMRAASLAIGTTRGAEIISAEIILHLKQSGAL